MKIKCKECGRCISGEFSFPLRCICGRMIGNKTTADLVKKKPEKTLQQFIREIAGCNCSSLNPKEIVEKTGLSAKEVNNRIAIARQLYDRQFKYPEIKTRNLAYHIYPAGDWKAIVSELSKHLDVFNGRKIIAVAGGSPAVAKDVRRLLRFDEIRLFDNDPDLRETVTFPWLLSRVINDAPDEATFYAHTKANSTNDNANAATAWRKVMVDNLLGRWRDAMINLRNHVFAGTHKMIWPASAQSPFPTRIKPAHSWMHCGTFWWFRHDQVSKLHRPELITQDRYGVEAWPAQLIPHEQAYSMWQPWEEHERAWPQRNPYDPGLYEGPERYES